MKDANSDFVWSQRLEGKSGEWTVGVIFSPDGLLREIIIPSMEALCRQKNIEMELLDEKCVSRAFCPGKKGETSRDSLIPIPEQKRFLAGVLSGCWLKTYIPEENLELNRRPLRRLFLGVTLGIGLLLLFAILYGFARSRAQEVELRLQNDWILHLAHILRGPLHSLGLVVESLPSASGEAKAALEGCLRREIGRLDSSCLQFVRKAKANLGLWELNPVRLELTTVVAELSGKLGLRYMGFNERVTLEIPGELKVLADAEALGELLENLMDNAIKYSPRGTPLTVTANGEKSKVRIVIKDHGIGLPPEILPRIGEPFFRGGQTDADGITGSGLGFHLSKKLCARMGGTLVIESAGLGQGAVVTLLLPAAM